MEFLSLSLPESAFLYMGLALQALVRLSNLRRLVHVIVGVWFVILAYRALRQQQVWAAVLVPVSYACTSLLFCLLFWPEITPFGWFDRTLEPSQVASYAATQDPQAQVLTAADTGLVPTTLQGPTLVSPGFRLLLPVLTGWPLAMARAINDRTHRTFSSFLPMQWLLGMDLTAGATTAIQDWTHNCYVPVLHQVQTGSTIQTNADTLPWGNTAVSRALSARQVRPGAQTGITTQVVPGSTEVPCDLYRDAVLADTQAWLMHLRSPAGTPLLQVFEEDLGLEPVAQAQFFLYREVLRAAGPEIPAPSLMGIYAGLRGAAVAGKAVEGGVTAGLLRWLTTATTGPVGGAAIGIAQGLATEWQRTIEGLTRIVGIAVFLTWWTPYILGMASCVLLAFFPVFFLVWVLIPGSQFQPLLSYIVALWFTLWAPLWWALVDLFQRLGSTLAPQSANLILGLGNSAVSFIWSAIITVLGLLVIVYVTARLLFASLRAIGSVMRSAG